jgi:hypothetical protein
MLESIFGIAYEHLVKKGLEQLKKDAEFINSRNAIREAIFRELKFNKALLTEYRKQFDDVSNNAELFAARVKEFEAFATELSNELDFSAFSKLEDSFMPIELYFSGSVDLTTRWAEDKAHKSWAASIKSETELIERIYHRLKILRARWRSHQPTAYNSITYIEWLITQLVAPPKSSS